MFKLKRTTQTFFACTLWHLAKRGFVVSVLSVLLLPLFFLTRGGVGVPHAYAATSDNLNFQARLETTAGAIAPDGDYNIQFKLYDALSGGTLLWTETYYDSNGGTAGNDNRVRVANGYVTVNLGSQTAFPGTMPWDQQLYLTMNVGGTTQTATPTWDGEMSPRLKLTAVPYAFNAKTAGQIVSSSGANLASLSIAAPTSGNQTFTIQDQGAAGSYNILTQTQVNAGFIQNQFGAAQTTSNFWLSGTGRADTAFQAPLFDSSTAAALGVGTTNATSISIGKSTITTTVQGPFVANGSQFTNNGSTLLTGSTLSDFAASGAIGTAATTVDVYTTFVIPQTTAGRTLSLPTPTTGTAGRLTYVLNTGSTAFTMHSVSIQAGKAQTYIYDGTAWTATNIDGAGNGVTFIGTVDSQTKSADGAVVSGNGIYLQTADGTNPGLVSTGVQTFAGNKTFSGSVTANAGLAVTGVTTINTSGTANTQIGNGSTGTITIGNGSTGAIAIESGSSIGLTGTTNINTTGAAATNLGTGTGNTSVGNTTGTLGLTGSTVSVLGTTSINTTGTSTTTIGSATAGAVSITSNAASSFTTNSGALTLTSAAAATWGTNAGLLTLQGAGGATVTSTAGTTSSNTTISTGNASAGASGNIVIDTGTATTTAGTVSIGTTNASGVTIGRATTTTTIQGNTVITLSATTGSTFVCQNGSSQLATCTSMPLTSSTGIQNQNASQQASSNFWISGTGRADTSILTPLVDTATATALNIGTTNATQINLNKNVSIAANQNITFAAGTGSFDQSASSGTFKTGTGAVSLNGDTTVATGKNLTVTSGSTALNGQTTIAASIAGPLLTVNQSGAGNILNLQNAGTNVLSVTSTGATSIVTTTASNSEFSIRTGGTYLFNFDSTNRITVDNGTITPDNLLENPGFESDASAGFSGWSLVAASTIETANPYKGTRNLAITPDGTTIGVPDSKYYMAVPGETFYVEGWTKIASGTNGSASIAITYYNASNTVLSNTLISANNTTTYAKVSGTGTAPANTAYIRVRPLIDNSSTTGTWYFDDLYFAKVSQPQPLSIRPTTNATNVLEVQNAAGTQIFAVNTTSGTATIQGNTILTSATGIQLQASTPGTAQTGHFNISGTGIASTFNASTSVLTPLVDTATATALNIGTTNATAINLNQDTVLAAGQSITITGGNTASRPASPTEGMVYYDTTTKQLLVYANGKWQADRTDALLVAASNSSVADKAAADYVGDGNTGAANDGDQVEINAALTAAAGKKVVLLAGTYTVDASVSVPNNTTLSGVGAGTVITIPTNYANSSIITNSDQTTGTGIAIHNLKVDGNRANQFAERNGIVINAGGGTGATSRHGVDVENVHVEHVSGAALWLYIINSHIANNTVIDSNQGIIIIDSTNSIVSDNTIIDVTQVAIDVATTSSDILVSNNIIARTSAGSTYEGIYLEENSTRITVSNNNISNFASGISVYNGGFNTVHGNTVNDSGGLTANDAIIIGTGDGTTVSNNTIYDSSATTTNYGIIINLGMQDTVLQGNALFNNAIIYDLDQSTIYLGQNMGGSGGVRFRQPISTSAFQIQDENGINYFTANTSASNIQVGSATTDATAILFGLDGYNNGTDPTGYNGAMYYNTNTNKFRCYESGAWSNCTASAANVIQNQNTSAQTTANFWISGTGRADTSVLTPLVDTATATALNIGTTNATQINLNQDTVLAAGQSITITGGNTASRPASPTEGMVYYDTTTKQLLTYANGKWQADRSTATKIVGTSASGGASSAVASQNYDAADYVNTSTTNAETVINNALTAVGSAGGGTVYLMEGTYVVSASVAIPNNVTLVGAGAGTVLKFANATNLSVGLIQNSDTTNGHHVTVHHLTLDGNKSNQSSGSALGILFAGLGTGTTTVGTHIYDIWVGNFTDVGIKFTTVSRSSITGVSSYNNNNNGLSLSGASYISVTGNNFSDNTNTNASGISLSGTALNNTITGNILNNNGGTGISVTASSAGNAITGNTANYNVTSGISLSNALNNTISANTVRGSGAHGIRVSTSSNNTISGNTVDDSGQTSANNDAIIILNNSLSNLVTDNKLTDTAGTGYAIEIQAGSNTNTIGSNLIGTGANGVWNGSGAITDLATGTIWQNQTDNSGNLRNSTANTSGYFYNNSTTAATIVSRLQTGSTQDLFQAQDGTGATVLMRVTSAGALQAPSLDTTTGSTALAIGSTNATSVTIAKSTVNTTIASNTTYLGTNNGTIVLSAVAQTGAATGNGLTIKAGTGGTGNQNGGTLALSGGDASGTGVKGLVTLNPTAFTGTSQSCSAASCSITAATVDANSTALVNNTYAGSTVTLADPTITTAGRVLYVTNSGTQDMTLSVNGGGTGNTIALKPNTTATMFWNGVDWTAAGASSATDLQAAYNNTQSTAGGAEIVLKSTLDTPAGTGGMTIRNNSGLPISGGLLEVQTSIGTNLFSVNSYGTELASNGGAETAGGSATTFPSSTWSAQSTATVSRTITSGEYQTGEAGVKVVTTGLNQGVRNQLTGNPVASTTYTVSFTAASTTAGQFTTPIEVIYSPDNGTTLTNICQGYGLEGTTLRTTFRNISNATNYNWTKVTCTVTTTGAAVTTPLLIVRQTDATARTIYIDNLSFIRNDSTTRPANVQMGGGNTGGQVTLFTLDRSSTAPLVSNGDDRYIGSMYYDTTLGNIQCYEADGWGACGSAPDNIITYTPEYTGAVLNGTGVGTMTADFCGNGGGLSVNTGFCASGEARNYYRWTSPQASDQTYSIYVSYRLPSTFKEFESGTTSLISLVDNTSNASVKYAIFKKTSTGGLTSCSADATMSGTVSTWNSTTPTTDLGTGACHTGGATPFAAGDTMVVRITVSAKSNASAYVENLTFRYSNK